MASRKDSFLDSATKNLALTLELEIPLEPSGLCSSSANISLGPVKVQLGTSTQPGIISPPSRSDLEVIGNSDSLDTTGGQLP
jgi:hypothetical protein